MKIVVVFPILSAMSSRLVIKIKTKEYIGYNSTIDLSFFVAVGSLDFFYSLFMQ
jgi:hypothetical protein